MRELGWWLRIWMAWLTIVLIKKLKSITMRRLI
jgi:hypothetical protein